MQSIANYLNIISFFCKLQVPIFPYLNKQIKFIPKHVPYNKNQIEPTFILFFRIRFYIMPCAVHITKTSTLFFCLLYYIECVVCTYNSHLMNVRVKHLIFKYFIVK